MTRTEGPAQYHPYAYYFVARVMGRTYVDSVSFGWTNAGFFTRPCRWDCLFFPFILAVLFLDRSATPLHAASDWPMFRGNPSLNGVAPGSLASDLKLLWTFKTGGPVKSSPAIVQGRVFVGSDDTFLYAIDFTTGQKRWALKTDGAIESSPLVLENKVYVGSDDGAMRAVNAADGTLRWKFETGDKIPGSPNFAPAPDGKGHWLVFGSFDAKLYCIEAATGRSNWVFETGTGIKGTPAVAAGLTAVGGCDAMLRVVSVKDGTQLKEVEIGAPMLGSVAMQDGRAYVGHYENVFLCIDVEKGTNLWSYQDRAFPYVSSPAIIGEQVLIGGRDKRLHCLRRDTGAVTWTFSTRGKVDSSPAVAGDKVVVGSDDGRLYLVSLKDGKELWQYEIGQAVTSSPAVADGKVVVGSEDGNVYCFGPGTVPGSGAGQGTSPSK